MANALPDGFPLRLCDKDLCRAIDELSLSLRTK
jgi:hypothetical protein